MSTAANPNAYDGPFGQRPDGRNSAWGPAWSEPPFWHPEGMSRPLGIGLMVLGAALWWPIGLALLVFMIASGRLGCGRRRWMRGRAQGGSAGGPWRASGCGWTPPWSRWGGGDREQPSSGNRAFDEYRTETLRRMEEEQTEFASFLERLRMAKDKAEFDQFMAERRRGDHTPPPVPPSDPSGEPGRG
jgi:Protein of unknown function (DUF2852)